MRREHCTKQEYADTTKEASTRTATLEVGLYLHRLGQKMWCTEKVKKEIANGRSSINKLSKVRLGTVEVLLLEKTHTAVN